MGHQNVVRV